MTRELLEVPASSLSCVAKFVLAALSLLASMPVGQLTAFSFLSLGNQWKPHFLPL